jgi:hypothetical protein
MSTRPRESRQLVLQGKKTMMPFAKYAHLSCALLLVFSLGCGDSSGPQLAPVTGRVTVGGSDPFQKGVIRFIPKDQKLNVREATTDDDGNYVIMFNANRRGLQPGDYEVGFSLMQLEDGSPLPEDVTDPVEAGAVEFVPREYGIGSTMNPTTVPETGGTFDFDIPEIKPQPKTKSAGSSRSGRY